MTINFAVDTKSTHDLEALATLAAAFGTGTPAAQTNSPAAKQSTSAPVKKDPEPGAAGTTAKQGAATQAGRVTVEMVRGAMGKKNSAGVRECIAKLGFEGLSKVPADRLGDLLELVNELPNK